MTHSFLLFKIQGPVGQTQILPGKGALGGQIPVPDSTGKGELIVMGFPSRCSQCTGETSLLSEGSQSREGDTQVTPQRTQAWKIRPR